MSVRGQDATALCFLLAACGPMPGYESAKDQEAKKTAATRGDDRYARESEGPSSETAPPSPSGGSIWFVETGDRMSYYVVDGDRRLCFFRHREAMTQVDCRDVVPAGGEREVSPGSEEPTREEVDEPRSPFDETVAFAKAYAEVLCSARAGQAPAPGSAAERHGLSLERYAEIEVRIRKDPKAWRSLRTRAAASCGGGEEAGGGDAAPVEEQAAP